MITYLLGSSSHALAAEAGIASLYLLSSSPHRYLDESILVKLVVFTDAQGLWTTPTAASVASTILDEQLTDEKLSQFIVGPVLQLSLRPMLAKSSSRITASGRPAQYASADDGSLQPGTSQTWQNQAPWVISMMQWAVSKAEVSLPGHHLSVPARMKHFAPCSQADSIYSKPSTIKANWPLFTPLLLSLAEDSSTAVKCKGLEILAMFVEKCPSQVLEKTGIGRVFEDATFPTLLQLPGLTREDESVRLLPPAYQVLLKLAESQSPQDSDRRRLLDKVIREGIFAGAFHASQYAKIVQILMQETVSIIDCMGIFSIKHLNVR